MIHSAIVDPQSSRQRKLPIPSAISSSSPIEDRQRVEAEGEFYRQLTARPWAVAIDAAKLPDQPGSTPILLTELGEIFTCGTRRFPSSPNTEPAGAA